MNAPHLPAVTRPNSLFLMPSSPELKGSKTQADVEIKFSRSVHTGVAACSSNGSLSRFLDAERRTTRISNYKYTLGDNDRVGSEH